MVFTIITILNIKSHPNALPSDLLPEEFWNFEVNVANSLIARDSFSSVSTRTQCCSIQLCTHFVPFLIAFWSTKNHGTALQNTQGRARNVEQILGKAEGLLPISEKLCILHCSCCLLSFGLKNLLLKNGHVMVQLSAQLLEGGCDHLTGCFLLLFVHLSAVHFVKLDKVGPGVGIRLFVGNF